MAQKDAAKKPIIITVDGTAYLGFLKEKTNGATITNSMTLGETANVQKSHLINYMVAASTFKLNKDITITGANVSIGQQELSDDLELQYEILEKQFAQAEKQTLPELVATRFKELAR